MSRLVRGLAVGILAVAAMLGGCEAKDRMRATLGSPAVVTAGLAGARLTDLPNTGAPRLIVDIVAFTPPSDKKPVEIVVRAARAGEPSHELGRVAITPYAAFGVHDTARRQSFGFALPGDLQGAASLSLEVALEPVNGGGKGASLEVGEASIR